MFKLYGGHMYHLTPEQGQPLKLYTMGTDIASGVNKDLSVLIWNLYRQASEKLCSLPDGTINLYVTEQTSQTVTTILDCEVEYQTIFRR